MNNLKSYFYDLADFFSKKLHGSEVYTLYLKSEASDFCRLNSNKIRQSGKVSQIYLQLRLIADERQTVSEITLSGIRSEDESKLTVTLESLRTILKSIPKDPYLLINDKVKSSEKMVASQLPDARATVEQIITRSTGLDLVGIYAAGGIFRGFANSFGQRNWYQSFNFNFNWSLYAGTDKAFKSDYAGFRWDDSRFNEKLDLAKAGLAILQKPPKTIDPGVYRSYLAPGALAEIVDILSWGCFGLKAQRTKQSPFVKMITEGKTLNPKIYIRENIAEGTAPNFDGAGFMEPENVDLIKSGSLVGQLISPRSAKEFSMDPTGASDDESPESIDIGAGEVSRSDILRKLDTGIYVNNLWYLNYSDRNACRLTGMTRFATYWVENGKIVAPLNVMRFDDSVYEFLGAGLEGLTSERDFILGASTYSQRSTNSYRLPGALISGFCFTL